LFCGCGGLDLGFKESEFGFELVFACDSDPAAVDAYARNVDGRVLALDVRDQSFRDAVSGVGPVDVVLGGFPCQGFSKAGPKRADDVRNHLYREMLWAVGQLKPNVFVAENVDGLSQNFSGVFVQRIAADFRDIGYSVEHRVLDALAYGVPQHRRRIFFVGVREGSYRFGWPPPSHASRVRNGEFKVDLEPLLWDERLAKLYPFRTIGDALSDLLELNPSVADHAVTGAWPKKYSVVFRAIGRGQKLCNVRHSDASVRTWDIPEVFGEVSPGQKAILETIARHRRHRVYGDIPNGNPLPIEEIERLLGVGVADEVESLVRKRYLKRLPGGFDLRGAMFCSGLFRRPRWDEPSPTVLTNFHNPRYFLHPLADRPFSLRECARLQGFPDSFVLTSPVVGLVDGYKLVGNAVPPPLARAFASAVGRLLETAVGREEVSVEAAVG